MLDISLLREKPDFVKEKISLKGAGPELVDAFLELDAKWRAATSSLDEARAKQNELSNARDIEGGKKNKEKIKDLESQVADLEKERNVAWGEIPNLPAGGVPAGKNESENKVLRSWGEPAKFDFAAKDHLALGEALGIIDFETGAKVSGSGFYYLKNDGVFLELALARYALDFLRKKNFDVFVTPDAALEKFYLGTGYNPKGPEAQTYTLSGTDLGLIATSEVTLAGIHADEKLGEDELPKLYAGLSHCFRREDGAYGKYSKGLYRVHQFTKVEMFVYAKPEDSPKIHEMLLAHEEELWQSLGIPYRVLEMCSGDLGSQAARKFDIEAWMPGRGDWGEVTSASNTTDYQARRLGIKMKKGKETEFVHTLNGTAIATSRAIIAILENYQTKEGYVRIPEALQPYVGKDIIKNVD